MTPSASPARRFVPAQLDVSNPAEVRPLYQTLLDRPVDTPADLERWLLDASELAAVVDEYGSRRYIDKSCHTDDEAIQRAYLHFIENVEPELKPLHFGLQKKLVAHPAAAALREKDSKRYGVLFRRWGADVELFREENVALETEAQKVVNEYDKLQGAMTIQFRGKEYTPQQMGRFLEDPDRPTRQESWEAVAARRLADRDAIDGLFDQLVPLRQRIAQNAGLSDYRAYVWKSYKRFDYTPEDCLRFSDAIAEVCMPVVLELNRKRAAALGVETLRPWDLDVDPKHQPALRPFDMNEVDTFVAKTKTIIDRLSPQLGEEFDSLRVNKNLDLASRKGKQPGGYQANLEESHQPFIFMNAAGMNKDVETLLHEAGHAFHSLAAKDEPLMFLRSAPMEFCEVASMSMELLGSEHFDVFYNEADAHRARRKMFEGIIRFFPWMTTIDTFQHWIYTHPTHTHAERAAEWLRLQDRFGGALDWTGYEDARAALWQRQLHLFHAPFYYIEYGIAQLGALQLWMKSKEDPRRALVNYRSALKLGGTRGLPELFAAAGISFDFSRKTLEPLIHALRAELAGNEE